MKSVVSLFVRLSCFSESSLVRLNYASPDVTVAKNEEQRLATHASAGYNTA